MLLITLQEEEEEGVDVAEEEEDTWEAEVRHLSLCVLLFGILFHSIKIELFIYQSFSLETRENITIKP